MVAGTIFPSSSNKEQLNRNPQITNVVVSTINAEQSITLAADIRKFTLKCRGNAKIQLCFVSAQSNSNYMTLGPGNILTEENLDQGLTIYYQLDRADTVELLTWQKV